MKTKIWIIAALAAVLGFGGFRVIEHLTKEEAVVSPQSVPVQVEEIMLSEIESALVYQGRVVPDKVEKVSFKSTARLKSLNGAVGDRLEAGTVLAELETTDLELALQAADSQLEVAMADYNRAAGGTRDEDIALAAIGVEKAQEAVTFLKDKLEDTEALSATGAVSQSEIDDVSLELTLAEKDLALAKETYAKALAGAETEAIQAARAQADMAASGKASQQSLIDDAVYQLTEPMVLVDKFYEPGELVPAGYPVALLRSEVQEVLVGVTSKDLPKIYIGQPVTVVTGQGGSAGRVTRIAEIPDESHFLYEVEVGLDFADYIIGELAECRFLLDNYSGFEVPVTAVMKDGIDYIYVVRDGKAQLQQVVIEDIHDGYAVVRGVKAGEQMVVSNLVRIHDQCSVTVEE